MDEVRRNAIAQTRLAARESCGKLRAILASRTRSR